MRKINELILSCLRSRSRQIKPYFVIQTASVTSKCAGFAKRERTKGRFFRDGDWDKHTQSIEDFSLIDPRYLFYKEHIFDSIPIKQTTAYAYHRKRQALGRSRRGFETEDTIFAQLERYVQIFRSIEHAGMVTPSYKMKGHRGDEIGCVLGREGQVLKLSNGNNRFAIASILQIPVIPVQFHFIHKDLLKTVCSQPGILPGQKVNQFLLDRVCVTL
ncbi:MAG: hypothetical protein EA386_07510 [Rhodobacteraceae bacterium]|nr:MAG: hypothetical protein EA386_07510 [Paracoccaceae bacterium]